MTVAPGDHRMFAPIDRCVAYRCNIRLRKAFRYSSGASEKPVIQVIIVELASGDVSGFGEFYATSLNYPPGIPGTSSLAEWDEVLSTCGSLLGKDAVGLRTLIPEHYNGVADASGIVDCIDFALHDLVGKSKGLPVWALLGGRRARSMPVMPVIHTDDMEVMVQKALRWQAQWGLRLFKIKPHADYDKDVQMMKTFSQELKPGTRFLLDANYAYKSVDEAATTLSDVAQYGVFLAEDPIEKDYSVYQQKLKPQLNRAGVKLMLDQQARTMADVFEIGSCQAADVINFHANWHSGFSGALDRAHVAAASGMENFIGSAIYAGIADAANITLAAVCPALLVCEQVRGADFYLEGDSVVDEFYPLQNGAYQIPDRPGLGIEVNRDKLDKLTEERVEM
jgi:L-alanine-DL-glutamate epimerase-like enolase superfamily enzyme